MQELLQLLNSASFEARKFSSNCPDILDDLPVDFKSPSEVQSVLGVNWDSRNDSLGMKAVHFDSENLVSKRHILSNISKIFDPMGFLQPLIITAKLLLQDLVKEGLTWNQEVSERSRKRWLEVRESFSDLSFVKVGRWMAPAEDERIELHGFADASGAAYGAVLYLKFGKTNPRIYFVLAKSRVAPLKITSIPRLELKAALLLTDIMKKVLGLLEAEGLHPTPYG